ncbi:uncharacterized protein MELLADRAFT_123752 [Melampsora larici-populina 98AG31]|uniref:Secreted protein n=1 Tax=Melampsora larici-populina (strain 98AG31 / pathotype 3-4-7) TaxID=747676 RepID=F4SCI0_MELLP|nr:uncharacterized protein MELLADRAFT_123752 [Melampsora larici-populina 98AG31]EGF97639.1 secreted protein [Melampsora larici-populina 98AG31]
MLRYFLKISTLLLSLWIYSLEVATVDGELIFCTAGFTVNKDKTDAVCKKNDLNNVKNYDCPYSRCWCQNHHWTPFTGCRLKKSKIKGTSNQDCAEYDSLPDRTFSCRNPAGVDYICDPSPGSPDIPPMVCDNCKQGK